MDVEYLDHIPITIEAFLRGKTIFVIHIPLGFLNEESIKNALTDAFAQLLEDGALSDIVSDVVEIIHNGYN